MLEAKIGDVSNDILGYSLLYIVSVHRFEISHIDLSLSFLTPEGYILSMLYAMTDCPRPIYTLSVMIGSIFRIGLRKAY